MYMHIYTYIYMYVYVCIYIYIHNVITINIIVMIIRMIAAPDSEAPDSSSREGAGSALTLFLDLSFVKRKKQRNNKSHLAKTVP